MKTKDKHRNDLAKYAMASGFRAPIYRVEHCMDTLCRKLVAVSWCCQMVLLDVDGTSNEGEALHGAIDLIEDIERKLHQAARLLHRELENER